MNAGLEKARLAPRKKQPSLRKAINEKCKDCGYDDQSGLGTWRQQTEGCTVKLCPLWPVRPLSEKKKVEA